MRFLFFLLALPGGFPLPQGVDMAAAALSVSKDGNRVSIIAENAALSDVLTEVRQRLRVEFYGLEKRAADAVTFSVERESVENAVKRLLRYLNEDNYILVYTRTRLKIVSVPAGGGPLSSVPPGRRGLEGTEERRTEGLRMSAVRILRIVPDGQAAGLNLKVGDLVVEYDGRAVSSSRQLVQMVKARSDADTVDLVVYRGGHPIRQFLRGGMIGIQVANTQVPPEEIGQKAAN